MLKFQKMRKIFVIILIFLAVFTPPVQAQVDTVLTRQQLTLNQFLSLVSKKNLEYAAEKYNVDISEAEVELAKVFPNPYLSFEWNEFRISHNRVGYGFIPEIGTTIELGGKRKARVDLASSQKDLSQALLNDYFRNLRAEAATVYLEAMKQNELYKVKKNSYLTMKRLADADSIRLSLGNIMETNAIQSKLEAGMLLNELLQKEADRSNANNRINLMAGISNKDTLLLPIDTLIKITRHFDLNSLIMTAEENRSDLEAARYDKMAASKALTLAKRARVIDMDLTIYNENEFPVPERAPDAWTINAGVAIPLKFSNMYKGDLKSAQFMQLQAQKRLAFVQLNIRIEITEAYQNYLSAEKQVDNFQVNLLNQSRKVLEGIIYSYQRGETSLLEVLNAQRTFNEIQNTYIEALFNYYSAMVELEKAAGIWDISFLSRKLKNDH